MIQDGIAVEDLPLLHLGLSSNADSQDTRLARQLQVLVLADGDCGYSASLARARPDVWVSATTYDGRSSVPEEHAAVVSELLCEVDATEPLPGTAWDRIVVNFPTPIGRQHVACSRLLIRRLLARAAQVLAGQGEIWLTLEEGVAVPIAAKDSRNAVKGSSDWDVVDAVADAELILVALCPARARDVYVPGGGVKSDGILHVLAQAGAGRQSVCQTTLVRDVNVQACTSLDQLSNRVSQICAPIEVNLQLLNSYVSGDANEYWTVRVEFTTDRHAISRRKAHALCEAIACDQKELDLTPAADLLQGPAPRRPGWAVWCHRVEPSIEDFLALVARPVHRAQDANLIWANAAWTHPVAFVNHFVDAVIDKRGTARILSKSKHLPRTFVLPDGEDAWTKVSCPLWIAKPGRLGRGVSVIVFADNARPSGLQGVVSEYVSPPLCLGGRKVDLRLYVLVRQLAPLEAYVHSNGYVRFAALPYSLDDFSAQRHLTNNSVNRVACVPPPQLAGYEFGPGDNWPLCGLWQHVDKDEVWPRIKVLLAEVLGLLAPELRQRGEGTPFAFLGFDVLLDESLRPWLCEINANPTLESKRILDRTVDMEVITDLLIQLEGGKPSRWEALEVM